jgi:hypothetical protein
MMPARPTLERRVLSAFEQTPARIPVLVGGCGTGRTTTLLGLRERLGRRAAQYVDVERVATTPERFFESITASTPFATPPSGRPDGARAAFDAAVEWLSVAHNDGMAGVFLLDEVLELRTFESFPGLRTVMRDLLAALPESANRFVLTSRYQHRLQRILPDNGRFEIIPMPPLSIAEIASVLPVRRGQEADRDDLARAIHALAAGRPAYVRMIADTMAAMDRGGGSDPISALAALLIGGGALDAACRYCYELRLHRARGYGALKAILDVLAQREPLTLTEISQQLKRTPGSTKDYLSWLEDVDLLTVRHKRYSYADPLLRLWVRLHGQPEPASEERIAHELHEYALTRLPRAEPEPAMVAAGRDKWGIIEID